MLNLSQNICIDRHVDYKFDPSTYGSHSEAISFLQKHYGFEHIDIGYGISEIIQRLGQYMRDNNLTLTISEDSWPGIYQLDIPKGGDVLYIVNPHSHRGTYVTPDYIREIASKYKMVIVDEAYGDFANVSVIPNKPDNVIVLKTMSKSLPLPGARFGWVLSNKEVNEYLSARRPRCAVIGGLPEQLPAMFHEIPDHVARMLKTKLYLAATANGILTAGNYILFDKENEYTKKFQCNRSHYKIRMALCDMETLNGCP